MIPKINRENSYRITIEEVTSGQDTGKSLSFEFQDREDLFKAVENIKKGSGLEAPLATRVAVALRLYRPCDDAKPQASTIFGFYASL
ncbi:DUF3861 family protein [Shewanella sp. UCD-KL21]|uniref:DUF3861 family protein n=1 Tax=Shewanella sp. UCD-KL21 TaxID=1917164 RepID=UPI001C37B4D7|nr:DUF3861 family protein [Shewanella sp. UCD-KL21]